MSRIPTPPIHPPENWSTSTSSKPVQPPLVSLEAMSRGAARYPQLLDLVLITDLNGVVAQRPITWVQDHRDPHSAISAHGLTGLRLAAGYRIPYSRDSSARGCWRWPDDQLSSPPPLPTRPARLPDVYDTVIVTGLCGNSARVTVTAPPSPTDPSFKLHVYRRTSGLRFPDAYGGAIPYSAAGSPGTWRWPD